MSVTISYPSTQFEELYGPFINLGAHLPPKHNSPKNILREYIYNQTERKINGKRKTWNRERRQVVRAMRSETGGDEL